MNDTNKKDDGGPAFPESASGPYPNGEILAGRPGMSLRDWFAGMALQGVMTNATGLGEMEAADRANLLKQVAELLYETADAMLAARKEVPGE